MVIVNHLKKIETAPLSYCLRETPFGPVALIWRLCGRQPKIEKILISKSGAPADQRVKETFPGSLSCSCPEVNLVADRIAAFLKGNDICFSLKSVRLSLCSEFQQKVLLAEYGIPRGRVSTYQRIAKHLGNAHGARAVGTALANNPFPIVIPCHRAIRSDGTLGGYQGGLKMKRVLLEMEGIRFKKDGRVSTAEFFY
jgi:methylated-DNA-[protein]-cysteine S-methyltransferase